MQTSENQCFYCTEHRECQYQFILLKKGPCEKRLCCTFCLYSKESKSWKPEINESIPLNIALQNPNFFIEKLIQSSYLSHLYEISEIDYEKQINDQILRFQFLEQLMLKVKEQLATKLKEYKECNPKLISQEKNYQKLNLIYFLQQVQYKSIVKLISQLKDLDKQYQSDQYSQIEKLLTNILNDIFKDNCALIQSKIALAIQNHQNLYQKYIFQIKRLSKPQSDQFISSTSEQFQMYDDFIEKLNWSLSPYIKSLEPLIDDIVKLANKQIKEKILIFLGTRDGLNATSFWNKVDGKKNLLIICKSQCNEVFGGYSPCQWQKSLSNYVLDNTLTSFLFSQTEKQIYRLQSGQQSYAIYCHPQYGPTFGSGHDMLIASNFQGGSSALGNSYQSGNLLFGETTPKIVDCEIYEVILN